MVLELAPVQIDDCSECFLKRWPSKQEMTCSSYLIGTVFAWFEYKMENFNLRLAEDWLLCLAEAQLLGYSALIFSSVWVYIKLGCSSLQMETTLGQILSLKFRNQFSPNRCQCRDDWCSDACEVEWLCINWPSLLAGTTWYVMISLMLPVWRRPWKLWVAWKSSYCRIFRKYLQNFSWCGKSKSWIHLNKTSLN